MTPPRPTTTEEAIAAIEQGRAGDVWLALPSVLRWLTGRGIPPDEILGAIADSTLEVRDFGPRRRPPDPERCGINAVALASWLATRGMTRH